MLKWFEPSLILNFLCLLTLIIHDPWIIRVKGTVSWAAHMQDYCPCISLNWTWTFQVLSKHCTCTVHDIVSSREKGISFWPATDISQIPDLPFCLCVKMNLGAKPFHIHENVMHLQVPFYANQTHFDFSNELGFAWALILKLRCKVTWPCLISQNLPVALLDRGCYHKKSF